MSSAASSNTPDPIRSAVEKMDPLTITLLMTHVNQERGLAPARVAFARSLVLLDSRILADLASQLCVSVEALSDAISKLPDSEFGSASRLGSLCVGCAWEPAALFCTSCAELVEYFDLKVFKPRCDICDRNFSAAEFVRHPCVAPLQNCDKCGTDFGIGDFAGHLCAAPSE
ncbi:hypothetical protein CF319_g2482 [Tilletia indica]|nr:hypothetical protein CF319_g2482 [Tilletia indica]